MEVMLSSASASVAPPTSDFLLSESKSDIKETSAAPSTLAVSSKLVIEPSSASTLSAEVLPSAAEISSSSSSNTKPAYKAIKVRTNGAALWEKMIAKASAPPYEYRPLAIHFNSTIPEIFEQICHYLDGLAIFGLYMTGDKRMQSRIVNTADDLRFVRNEGLYPFEVKTSKWPTFVKEFTNLRHFKIQYWPIEQFTSRTKAFTNLTMLSKTLNTLYLDCEFDDYSKLKEFTNLETLTLARLLRDTDIRRTVSVPAEDLPPHLTYLDMALNMTLPLEIPRELEVATAEQRALVPGLQRLKYISLRYETSLNIALFAVLNPDIAEIHLPQHKSFRPEWLIDLPKHVTALTLNFTISNGLLDFLSALPNTLVDLNITEAPDLRHSALTVLPKSITKLRFPATVNTNLELLVGAWPLKSIKELVVTGNASALVINDLPKDMKVLRLEGAIGDTLTMLPPNLEAISLPNTGATNYFVQIAPRTLTKLKIPGASISQLWYMPKHLTSLTMGGFFQNLDIEKFPRGLTKLNLIETNGLTGHCAIHLPRHLRTLRIYKNAIWDFSCVPFLPASLKVLVFSHSSLPALKQGYYNHQKFLQQKRLNSLKSLGGISE